MNFLTLVLLFASLALSNAAAVMRDGLKGYGNLHVRRDWSPVNTTFTCMYLTNEPNWAGEGQNLCQIGGICASQIPDGLAANVSSAGPSEGQTCFLYTAPNCAGTRSAPIVYPGIPDLNTIGFDKQALSWRCWKMCGYIIESSSMATTSTMQPTVPPPPSNSTSSSVTFTFDPTSTTAELRRRQDITTTLSSSSTEEGEGASITTTLTGSQPGVSITSTSTASPATSTTTASSETSTPSTLSATTSITIFTPPAPFSTTTTSSPSVNPADTTVTGPSSVETTSFALASGGGGGESSPPSTPSSSIDTNTPGFSMSPSPVTVTHMFADGSKTTETTSVLEPVPTVPTDTRRFS